AQKHFPDEPNIHNDLLCGSQDIISVEPIHRTIAICERIKENQDALELFENNEKEEVWEGLVAGKFPEVKTLIQEYITQ
ncbi:MAG: hypothetical protein ACPGVD_02605, partial [Flavobacteriales bacterium]